MMTSLPYSQILNEEHEYEDDEFGLILESKLVSLGFSQAIVAGEKSVFLEKNKNYHINTNGEFVTVPIIAYQDSPIGAYEREVVNKKKKELIRISIEKCLTDWEKLKNTIPSTSTTPQFIIPFGFLSAGGHWSCGKIIVNPSEKYVAITSYNPSSGCWALPEEEFKATTDCFIRNGFTSQEFLDHSQKSPNTHIVQTKVACGAYGVRGVCNIITSGKDRDVWNGIISENGQSINDIDPFSVTKTPATKPTTRQESDLRSEDRELLAGGCHAARELHITILQDLSIHESQNIAAPMPHEEDDTAEIIDRASSIKYNFLRTESSGHDPRDLYKPIAAETNKSDFSVLHTSSCYDSDHEKTGQNISRTVIFGLKEANLGFNFKPQEIAAIILVAIENEGLSSSAKIIDKSILDAKLMDDFKKIYSGHVELPSVDAAYLTSVRKFSQLFQKAMKEQGILTGNPAAVYREEGGFAGKRLKRLDPQYALAYCNDEPFVRRIKSKISPPVSSSPTNPDAIPAGTLFRSPSP